MPSRSGRGSVVVAFVLAVAMLGGEEVWAQNDFCSNNPGPGGWIICQEGSDSTNDIGH